jgi:transcriptional regulator with XRE-family HTH domain
MDPVRVGRSLRALRRERGWRQRDLAKTTGLSQAAISRIELGMLDGITIGVFCRVASALGAQPWLELRWRGAALDRLLDRRHARLLDLCVIRLEALGWTAQPEVSFAHFGERGSIDLLCWHDASRTLLVLEAKTELVSIEETLRRLDQKVRLAPGVARDRLGWKAAAVGRLLVMGESTSNRRRVAAHRGVLAAALPVSGRRAGAWLRDPVGPFAGLLFLPDTREVTHNQRATTPKRVRRLTGPRPERDHSPETVSGAGRTGVERESAHLRVTSRVSGDSGRVER